MTLWAVPFGSASISRSSPCSPSPWPSPCAAPPATLTIVFVGLTVLPVVLQASDIDPLVALAERMPNSAGTVFMNADTSPYGPGMGLLLLVLWALGTLALGFYVLRKRDA